MSFLSLAQICHRIGGLVLPTLLITILVCCGKEPEPKVEATNPPLNQQQKRNSQLPPLSLQQQFSKARNMGTTAPDATPRHFYMRGQINFLLEDPNANSSEHGLDLYVGGPDRMKLILRTKGRQQVFFLADSQHAWLRLPDAEAAKEYDSKELSDDSILRWMVLQFPWSATDLVDWPLAPAASSPAAEGSTTQTPAWPSLTIQEAGSDAPGWLFEFNSSGLLQSVSPADKPQQPVLELSDWKAGSSGRLYPGVWAWKKERGTLEERFESIADDSLFLDRLFVPSTHREGSAFFAGISGSLSPLRSAEQIGVGAAQLSWIGEGDWQEVEDPPPARSWWRYASGDPGQTVYLIEEGVTPPAGINIQQSKVGQEWLRWRTFKQLDAEQVSSTMSQIAERSGLLPTGELWIRQPLESDGEGERIYLLAVRKKG